MALIFNTALRLWHDECGQDLIEYGLLAGFIGLGAVASIKTLANDVKNALGNIGASLSSNV